MELQQETRVVRSESKTQREQKDKEETKSRKTESRPILWGQWELPDPLDQLEPLDQDPIQ
jgi:hypothetical protein